MLHVATVHYASPRWIEIQTAHLRRHLSVPYRTWTSLERIDPAYGSHFDHVLEQRGLHAAKLNNLAMEIAHEAAPEDLIMFLDGDAFPIADPMPLVTEGLARAPLVAVRRAENFDEPQPHPCFCVTTVETWRTLPGDWSAGRTWIGPRGHPTSDVGGNLLRALELSHTPWVQVLRSNRSDIDPLYFAVYGDVVYHHGAGFRIGELSPAHRALSPPATTPPGIPGVDAVLRLLDGRRFERWQRNTTRGQSRESERIYRRIAAGEEDWLSELM
jgi:hypothetical protein